MLRQGSVLLLATVVTLLGGLSTRASAKPPPPICAAFLASKTYSCTLVSESGPAGQDCWMTQAPGPGGAQASLTGFLFESTLSCECNPAGSGKKLRVAAAQSAFMCTGTAGSQATPVAVSGKVVAKGTKIIQGAVFFAGTSARPYAVHCEAVQSCPF
jgi:hypothetical protein